MNVRESEEVIEYGQVGVAYQYTACTYESEIAEEDLNYQWSVIWEEARDSIESYGASEVSASTSRVVTVKFLREGSYTLRCTVTSGEDVVSNGAITENIPGNVQLQKAFSYTACTPDTGINPIFLEYLWIIDYKDGEEWVDASSIVTVDKLYARSINVLFKEPGTYRLRAIVLSPVATDVFQGGEVCEIVYPDKIIGDVEIVRGKNRRFGAVHRQATAPREEMHYKWECENASIELANSRVCRITFGDYGTYLVKCTVTNKWALDSPVVATWEIEHSSDPKPDYQYPAWQKSAIGQRVFSDNNEFLGHPVHALNYNPASQANRFWKIWLDDIQGYSKKLCLVENEAGEIITIPLEYQHPNIPERWVSVHLYNIGTGNQFEDDHMDVRLYTMEKEEHPYDYMYVPAQRYFYLGVHRRETERLPFNVAIRLGEEYKKITEIKPEDRKYIMNLHDISPHW